MIDLRKIAGAALALVVAVCDNGGALAQSVSYPSRPIRLIVPFSAGGSSDILGRIVAEKLGGELGQTVVVDNRTGGNTVIGTQVAASSRPDGYTVLQVTPNAIIVGSLQDNLPYDLERDFTAVIGIGSVPLLLAVPAKSNIRSIADLTAAAKSMPGGVTYASGGVGSLGHLVPARFARDTKLAAMHVPYRGVAPAIQDVVANRVQFMFVTAPQGVQVAKTGGIRVLAVTSERRLAAMPEVRTMTELGFADFTPAVWYGYVVAAKTQKDIVDRLHDAIGKAVNDPAIQARLADLGLTVKIRNGGEFDRFMREEAIRWKRVVEENQIKLK
ncbi:MAG: tripartite tricarboxylate transporter substrate binding protein [Burkholderiales bacterium]|nr:tripartite tricarboxylate transporter substrate binding protein [Burkholderiales bacterium]